MCDGRKGHKPKVNQGVPHAGVATREVGYQGKVLKLEVYLELFMHILSLPHGGRSD